jgi:hypothetical protein
MFRGYAPPPAMCTPSASRASTAIQPTRRSAPSRTRAAARISSSSSIPEPLETPAFGHKVLASHVNPLRRALDALGPACGVTGNSSSPARCLSWTDR